jgi:tetratricopeptide (TPR) repeat protein
MGSATAGAADTEDHPGGEEKADENNNAEVQFPNKTAGDSGDGSVENVALEHQWVSRLSDESLRKAGFFNLLDQLDATLRLHLSSPKEESHRPEAMDMDESSALGKQQKKRRKKKKGKQAANSAEAGHKGGGAAWGFEAPSTSTDAGKAIEAENGQADGTPSTNADSSLPESISDDPMMVVDDNEDSLELLAGAASQPGVARLGGALDGKQPAGDASDFSIMEEAVKAAEARLVPGREDAAAIEAALSDFISVGLFWCLCETKRMDGATRIDENTINKCREIADASLWHVETLLCREQLVQEAYNTLCVRCEHAAEAFMHNEAASCQWSICRAESCLNITSNCTALVQICDCMREATFKIGTFCPCDRSSACNCVCSTWAHRACTAWVKAVCSLSDQGIKNEHAEAPFLHPGRLAHRLTDALDVLTKDRRFILQHTQEADLRWQRSLCCGKVGHYRQAFDDAHMCFKIDRMHSEGIHEQLEDSEVIARQIEALKRLPVYRERCASLLDDMATNLFSEFKSVAEEVQRWCTPSDTGAKTIAQSMAYQHIQLLKFTMKLSSPKAEVEALNAFIMEGDLPKALRAVEALRQQHTEDTLLLHAIRAQLLLSAVELALSKHSDVLRDVGMESTDYAECVGKHVFEENQTGLQRKALLLKAQLYVVAGRHASAKRVLHAAIELGPDEVDIRYQLLRICMVDGPAAQLKKQRAEMERIVSAARKEREDWRVEPESENELNLENGGSEPEPSAETEGEPETEAKPEPAPGAQTEAEAEAEAEFEVQAEVEAEAVGETEAKVEAATAGEAAGQADGEAEAVGEADTEAEEETITDMHHHALNAAASRMHHSANDGPYKDTHKTLEALSDSIQKLHEYEEHTLNSLPLGIQADACAILSAFNITAARRTSLRNEHKKHSMQDDDEAVRILRRSKRLCERALDMNPECWPALWFKASSLARLRDLSADQGGDARDGFECLDHLQRLFPDYAEQHLYQRERDAFWYGAHIERVQNTVRRGHADNDENLHRDYIEAWKSTTEVLKVKPEDVLGLRLHVQLLNYFVSRGEALMLSDLLQCCASLLRLNPRNGAAEQQSVHVETLRARAHAVVQYDLAQRPELIIADYRQVFADLSDAIELDPRNPCLFHMRASIYFKWIDADDRMGPLMVQKCIVDSAKALETHRLAKKSKSAASNSENMEPLAHDAADVRLMLGRCHMNVNNIREATSVLTEAVQIRGDSLPNGLFEEIQARKNEAEQMLSVEVDQAEKKLLGELQNDEDRQQQKAKQKAKKAKKQKQKAKKMAEEIEPIPETQLASQSDPTGDQAEVKEIGKDTGGHGSKVVNGQGSTQPKAAPTAATEQPAAQIEPTATTKEALDRLQEMFGNLDRPTLQEYLVRAANDINTACAWIFEEQEEKLSNSIQIVPSDEKLDAKVATGWSQVDKRSKKKTPKPRQQSANSARPQKSTGHPVSAGAAVKAKAPQTQPARPKAEPEAELATDAAPKSKSKAKAKPKPKAKGKASPERHLEPEPGPEPEPELEPELEPEPYLEPEVELEPEPEPELGLKPELLAQPELDSDEDDDIMFGDAALDDEDVPDTESPVQPEMIDEEMEKYCEIISKSGGYGGEMEVDVLSKVLDCQISVYQVRGGFRDVLPCYMLSVSD